MKGRFTRAQIRDIKYHSLRKSNGSDEELKALAKSWLHRPMHPIVLRLDMTVADGHRRLAGLILLGETEVDVFITDEKLTDTQLTQVGIATAILRADLTQPELMLAVESVFRDNPTLTAKEFAAETGMQEAAISRYRAVAKNPLVREPFLAEKITIAVASEIASAEPDAQAGLLNFALEGSVTRDQIIARKRKPVDAAVKMGRVCCPLSTGIKISVTGPEMTLSDYIEALTSALELARKSNKDSLDIKTAEKVWRDRSKIKG